MFNIKAKISKRLHPVENIKYDLLKNLRGMRPRRTAEKYGDPIDCHGASHVHNYWTLACNLKCRYCINHQIVERDKYPRFDRVDPMLFAEKVNRLWNLRELYFNGGEHFILRGFVEALNWLDGFNILLFTNLPAAGMDQITRLRNGTNNIFLDISYHPMQDDPVNLFVERLRAIPKGINWNIHIVKDPEISAYLYIDAFQRHGIYGVQVDCIFNPLLKHDPIKMVRCKSNEHLICPDLRVRRCLLHLLYGLKGEDFESYSWSHEYKECGFYPRCKIDCSYNEVEFI